MEHLESSQITEAVKDLNNPGFRTSPTKSIWSAAEVPLENINEENQTNNKLASNIVKKIFEPNHCDLYVKDEKEYIDGGKEILGQSVDTVVNEKSSVEVIPIENENNADDERRDKPIKVNTNSDVGSIVEMNEYDEEFINNDMETDDEFINNDNDELLDNDNDSEVLFICEEANNDRNRNQNSAVYAGNDNDVVIDNDRNYDSDVEYMCEDINNRARHNNSDVDKCKISDARNVVEANKDEFPEVVNKSRNIIPMKVEVSKSKESKRKRLLTGGIKLFNVEFNSEDELGDEISDNCDAEFLSDDDIYNTTRSDNSFNIDSVNVRNNVKVSNDKPAKVAANERKFVSKKEKNVKSKKIERKPAYLDGLKLFKITELSYEEQLVEFEERKESSRYKSSHYKCATCYKGCNTKNAYERHLLKHTRDFGDHVCSICKLRYRRRNFLNAHVREVHSNKYNCTSCTFVTKHIRLALLHEKWHNGITYECPHCMMKFTKVSSYFSHLRTKHPSNIVCSICGLSFIGEKGLHQHMTLIHRQENKDPVPTCEPCGITFSSKAAYKQHVKVTFKHRKNEFPTEKFSQASRSKALGMEEQVRDGMICSQHFTSDDFYVAKSGEKELRYSAVTSMVQACMICLDTDSKLYKLSKYNLEEAYRNLTGLELSNRFNLKTICIECAQMLINFNKFRQKCLRSRTLLMELFQKNEFFTVQKIKTINREKYNLTSSLSQKVFEPDHCDLHYIEFIGNKEKKYIEIDKCNIIHENDVKDESKDEMLIKLENLVDENNPDHGIDDDNTKFNDEVEFVDNERLSEVEFLNEDSIDSNSEVETKVVKRVRRTSKSKVKKDKPASKTIKLFKVASLNYEEQLADVVKRKESPNYQNSFYKCTMCYKGFNDKNAYNAHLLRHTNKFGDFECALCGLHFKLRYHLSHHIRQNHSWRYSCMTCAFVTKHKRSAYLHERWHKGTRYKCSHCDEQFIRVSTYMTHLRIKHPSEFSCTICGYSFVGRKGLDQHMNMKHRFEDVQNASGPACESCNIRFATDEAYNQHMKVSPKHSSDGIRKRNDPSGYCKRQYKGVRQRTADSDPVTCEQCGIELRDYRLYTHHFKRAHPDKNRTKYAPTSGHCLCEQCGKVFQSQALLRYHMPVHSGQTTFTCDVCDKGFMLRANLLIHKKIHSDTRESFECPVCGKSFAYQSNRARHMVLHNGLKPFKCEICEKNFSTAAERASHVAHVHLKKPWPKRNRGSRVTRHVRRRRDTTTVQDE